MDTKLAAANNQFGFDLFSQLQLKDKDKNIFFSPLSVAFALAMTYNGTAGETQRAMARALRLDGMSLIEVNEASAALMNSLKSSDPRIELDIANSLWARQGLQFKEDFLTRNREFFGAEIAAIDFSDPQAKSTINNWVSKSTKGKIPAIIDQIDNQMVLFLINAIYFKGLWENKFDKALTKDAPFHLLSGTQKPVPMMSQSGDYSYHLGDNFQAISLPYGKGGTSLYLFLPDKDSSLNGFLKSFNYEKCSRLMKSFRSMPGDVEIPRFKMEYESNLSGALRALGMGVAFAGDKADFSGMRNERDLFISEVKHKAIVEVNEEGTEAAAVTSVGIRTTSMMPTPKRFTFIADRPFLMTINDQKTGAILFMGVVVEPK
ncbi:MAG: serpin family protein [Acidobacteria bacterium]|nr:serpin family protein [Acidobacteriota bacterium]